MNTDVLVNALAELSHSAAHEFAVRDMLWRLCDVAGRAMDVTGAGVMMVEGGEMRFLHAAGSHVDRLERLQEILQQGPCRAAALERREVTVDDFADGWDRRWPEFTAGAMEHGLRSMVAIPLLSRQRVWGVLDLYSVRPGPWSAPEIEAGRVLADVAVSFIVIAADRDQARQVQRELAHRSMHDELTGLPNRALLFDRLSHALTSAARRDRSVAVFFVDLDHFKQINDTLGHAAGDTVLRTVGARMASTLRGSDTLARLAGDEFVLICEDLPQRTPGELEGQIGRVADRLGRIVRTPIGVAGAEVEVSASIGVVTSTPGQSAEDVLDAADAAMYEAKQRRHPAVVIRDHVQFTDGWERRHLDRDLIFAVERDELRLYFQPIVTADDRKVAAVEALLRWQHPQHGLMSASAFIGLAEATGMVGPIGRWVIDQACRQLAVWRSELTGAVPERCYVNLSPRELAESALDLTVQRALAEHNLDPHQLGLEVVESAFLDPLLAPTIACYHRRGHPLAVDDFGTGHSSLSRLVELPVSIAKIDRSFVSDVPDDARQRALIDAVLVVARHLGLQVVGEGVEAERQARYLRDVGCDLMQGFHLGRPQPGDTLTEVWRARTS